VGKIEVEDQLDDQEQVIQELRDRVRHPDLLTDEQKFYLYLAVALEQEVADTLSKEEVITIIRSIEVIAGPRFIRSLDAILTAHEHMERLSETQLVLLTALSYGLGGPNRMKYKFDALISLNVAMLFGK
jgi:hypothetical protein